jgi:short-subunit dehydrogenase
MSNGTVLITGSSKGLGKQLALVFARNGYDIVLHGRNKESLSGVKTEVSGAGVNCRVVVGDLKLDKTIDALHKMSVETDVSVLINNAGISLTPPGEDTDLRLGLDEITDGQIVDILSINLLAPMKLTSRLYRLFLKNNRGTVININSLLGLEPRALNTLYCSSKWGLRGFTDSFRLEAAKHGVRVIGVYPSRIKTRAFTDGMEPQDVARKIYSAFSTNSTDELILDERPKP